MIFNLVMKPIEWLGNRLKIIDQTQLPGKLAFAELRDYTEVVAAIKGMKVRGAPAIGVAAAYGIALGAQNIKAENKAKFLSQLDKILQAFAAARPTAVNLFRAIDRMKKVATAADVATIKQALIDEAKRIHAEEEAAQERLSRLGAELIKDGFTILTHCNTGSLATAGYGTALGVIKAAAQAGQENRCHRHRDPPPASGCPPHRLGADAGEHTGNVDNRLHGWLFHEPWQG